MDGVLDHGSTVGTRCVWKIRSPQVPHEVVVAGVGMTPFCKPGGSPSYDVMALAAIQDALGDAGIEPKDVQQGYAGYVFGDSTCGQAVWYRLGCSGIPIVNVHNNCSTGSSALWLARQAVEYGAVDCAIAFGFEQMLPGPLRIQHDDRPSPLARFEAVLDKAGSRDAEAPLAAQFFGAAGETHIRDYGTALETFAMIAVKARRHAAANTRALFRTPVTVDEVLASPRISGPLTRLQCCPPTCGAAAAVLCSTRFAERHRIDSSVRIAAQALTTDPESSFADQDMMKLVGYDMAEAAATQVYEQCGVGPEDVQVVELHDCFTSNELITYEALRLTPAGTAEKFVRDGDNTYGGRVVTNPSGGLLAKGHPLGATGLAQCFELVGQIRGQVGPRQVTGVRHALQHNVGFGGACVVTMYERHGN